MFSIRPMRVEDAKKAATVTAQAMKDSWNRYEKDYYPRKALKFDLFLHTAENYVKLIQKPNNFLFVAEEHNKIVGIAMGEIMRGNDKTGSCTALLDMCTPKTTAQWNRRGFAQQRYKTLQTTRMPQDNLIHVSSFDSSLEPLFQERLYSRSLSS